MEQPLPHSFLIAATSSSSGKTTVSLGLMRALVRRGLKVQPFKCGPDYIDTSFQTIATHRDSINLDLFMASEGHVWSLFSHYGGDTDVAVVEGVMGLFDGYDGMRGSSAEISRLLGIPVILVINAKSTAYSSAAIIYGFSHFCPGVEVAGVIFNRVASENHFSYLLKACEDAGVECLGYVKDTESLHVASRHLGLTLSSPENMDIFIGKAADEVEKNVDIDRLLAATSRKTRQFPKDIPSFSERTDMTAAVARDEAFSFIYPANLKAFGSVVYFSPIHDRHLPEADMVYLPGGYPELYASQLEANSSMRKDIKAFAESGGRILAECGGLIYLCEEVDGHAMCGIFQLKATMKDKKLTLGYREVELPAMSIRGHEFHYSRIESPLSLPSIATQRNVKGKIVDTPIYRYKNTIAGYTHLYWGETDITKLWTQ